jgi:acetyl-CoA synthetase
LSLHPEKYAQKKRVMDNGHSDLFPPLERIQSEAHVSSFEQYKEMYQRSVDDPAGFWGEISKQFFWKSPPTGEFLQYNFDCNKGKIFIKWMEGAETNICYNALDRNVESGMADTVAFYWLV